MSKDDHLEEKVVEVLNQSLKHINNRTAAKLKYFRNNALEHLKTKDKMIPNGKGGHLFAAIGWHRNSTKMLFSVFVILLMAWASITWQIRYHHDDSGAVDSSHHSDDPGSDSFLEDHHETWQHYVRTRK